MKEGKIRITEVEERKKCKSAILLVTPKILGPDL